MTTILLSIIIAQFNGLHSQTCKGYADGKCNVAENTPECEYDYGDCCEHTCEEGLWYGCGVAEPFNCTDPRSPNPTAQPTTDPTYAVIVPTQLVDRYLSDAEGVSHTPIESEEFCFDHPYDCYFVALGNWKLTTDESLITAPEWDDYCAYDDTTKTCDPSMYIDPDEFFVLTYCCQSNIWAIGAISEDSCGFPMGQYEYEGNFQFFAIGNGIEDIEEWHSWNNLWLGDGATAFSVDMFDHNCHSAGFIGSGVIIGLFFVLLIGVCVYYRPKSISALLDSFETYSSKIEFIVQGILLGDSFIASIFITIDVGISTISSGIIVMTFCVISFVMFGIRFKLSKSSILESENFGSLAGFTFDLCLSVYLIFMRTDIAGSADTEEGFNVFVFLLMIGTWGGVVEEFLQLLALFKWKPLLCLIGWYLLQSGRIIALINMFLLLFITIIYFTKEGDLNYGAAAVILLISIVMFAASIYSCYAYVGCCGKCGGHKKATEETEETEETPKNEDKTAENDNTTPSDGQTVTVNVEG